MNRLPIMTIFFLLASCQIADSDAPAQNEAFIKFYGNGSGQTAKDLEPIWDTANEAVEGYVIFGTQRNSNTLNDFYFVKTDHLGNKLAESVYSLVYSPPKDNQVVFIKDGSKLILYEEVVARALAIGQTMEAYINIEELKEEPLTIEEGSETNEFKTNQIAGQIKRLKDGGYIFIATSTVAWQDINSELDNNTTQIMTIGLLDENLKLRNIDENKDNEDMSEVEVINFSQLTLVGFFQQGNDILLTNDGNIVLAGAIYNDNDQDFFYEKYNLEMLISGNVEKARIFSFTTENGSLSGTDDRMVRVMENEAGNYVLFGYGEQVGNSGESGTNIYSQEIDSETGNTLNSRRIGIEIRTNNTITNNSSIDILYDVAPISTGYVLVGSAQITSNNIRPFFIRLLSDLSLVGTVNDTISLGYPTEPSNATTTVPSQAVATAITTTRGTNLMVVGTLLSPVISGIARSNEMFFAPVDINGKVDKQNLRSYGIANGNDAVADVISLGNGKLIVLGTIDFGGGLTMMSLMKLNENGEFDRK